MSKFIPDDNATVTNLDGEDYKIIIKTIIMLTTVPTMSRHCQKTPQNKTEKCLFSCPAQQMLLTPLVNYGLF